MKENWKYSNKEKENRGDETIRKQICIDDIYSAARAYAQPPDNKFDRHLRFSALNHYKGTIIDALAQYPEQQSIIAHKCPNFGQYVKAQLKHDSLDSLFEAHRRIQIHCRAVHSANQIHFLFYITASGYWQPLSDFPPFRPLQPGIKIW